MADDGFIEDVVDGFDEGVLMDDFIEDVVVDGFDEVVLWTAS